ncbi:MAG: CehA/McbA family metallohydrolase [Verrucomicrobia bacterium]|nr:CehA/McbA family metallohydrolase [Verrucomicrobiota bacterium]
MNRKNLLLGGITCLALLMAPSALGHGLTLPKPSATELAQIQPPLSGSTNFARTLFHHLRNQLNAAQTAQLDRIGQMLFFQDQLAGGFAHGSPSDTDYYRWVMETNLLALLETLPQVVTLDFRSGRPAHSPDAPVELNQQYNLVLLKTVTGPCLVRFEVQENDLISEQARDIPWPEGFNKRLIHIGENATTFTALLLQQTPPDKTILHLAFQNAGASKPHLWHGLTLVSSPLGNFSLLIRDEKDRPVPVMLRLTSNTGQRLFEPAGAVDLRPLMNEVTGLNFYGPGRGYRVHMAGPFAGHYWYVPDDFEMALPAGEWELHLFHGLEYVPLHETFRVDPGQWTRKTIRLTRHTDMAARGWFSGDDHTHARLMSSEDAQKLITLARAADIRVCNVLEMGDWMRSYYPQRGFGKEFRVHHGDYWVVPGQEDPRSLLGHAIGLNLSARVRDLHRYLLNDWWADQIHQQGGLYGHTHVGEKACLVEREMALFTPLGIVDFNSIVQTRLGTEFFYNFLNLGFKMTASSGEDMPYTGVLSASRLFAFCGTNQPFTPDLWFDSVKRGHTFVTTGPMLDFHVEEALPGDEIRVDADRPLRVHARAWGLAAHSAPVKLSLVKWGLTEKEVDATSDIQSELVLDTTVSAGHGFWLAAHAQGRDGSQALSTPVYVVREGFRFWSAPDADRLLKGQLEVLKQIDHALAECEKVVRDGTAPLDYWTRWGAEQAGEVRIRIERARNLYTELQAKLAAEQKLRSP